MYTFNLYKDPLQLFYFTKMFSSTSNIINNTYDNMNNKIDGKSIYEKFTYNKKKIRIVGNIDDPFFRAKDICKILNFDHDKKTIKKMINAIKPSCKKTLKKILKENNMELNTSRNNIFFKYKKNKEIYINNEGLKFLISKNKNLVDHIYNDLNNLNYIKKINSFIYKYNSNIKENIYIDEITNFFEDEYYIENYMVDEFSFHLFFPEYKLFIDCNNYNIFENNDLKSIKKKELIEDELGCKYISFNSDEENFNIYDVIKKINFYIINSLRS